MMTPLIDKYDPVNYTVRRPPKPDDAMTEWESWMNELMKSRKALKEAAESSKKARTEVDKDPSLVRPPPVWAANFQHALEDPAYFGEWVHWSEPPTVRGDYVSSRDKSDGWARNWNGKVWSRAFSLNIHDRSLPQRTRVHNIPSPTPRVYYRPRLL